METKKNFPNHFLTPRFATGRDQNQLLLSDLGWEKIYQVIPQLLSFLPKCDKRNNP